MIVRYSTSPSDIALDSVAALRGMGLKVIDVTKQNLSSEPDEAVTQDFLLVNGKAFPAADIAAFRKQILLLEKATQQPEELQTVLTTAARAGSAALRAVGVDTAGGYFGWLPAVGVTPPVTERSSDQLASSILLHAIYGATTVGAYRGLRNLES